MTKKISAPHQTAPTYSSNLCVTNKSPTHFNKSTCLHIHYLVVLKANIVILFIASPSVIEQRNRLREIVFVLKDILKI